MTIYNAQIIKRTAVEKKVYDDRWQREITTTFMFDEIDRNEFYQSEQAAKDALFRMIKYDYPSGTAWAPERFSFIYGDRAKYHSDFLYENGNTIDYFALINEIEVV